MNGSHPYYRWPIHENCIQREIPPNPIRHVKRPTEQFSKFGIENFPHSHFTTRESQDCVQYHPLYAGFRPLGDGTTNDLVDLMQDNPPFWPPENQEWFLPSADTDTTETKSDTVVNQQRSSLIIDDPFDTDKMLPYLSPTSLFAEEEEAVKRRAEGNWGKLGTASTRRESLQRWQETKDDHEISSENVPQQSMVEQSVMSSPITPIAVSEPSTSKRYVIPKKPNQSILSNKVNELVAKVSPPARSILPKPPGSQTPSKRPSYNHSGLRPQRRKK